MIPSTSVGFRQLPRTSAACVDGGWKMEAVELCGKQRKSHPKWKKIGRGGQNPSGQGGRHWGDVNRSLGARESGTTGRRVVLANGIYNSLVPDYTISSLCTNRRGGRTNTHGIGIHPDDGALQPQGTTLAYPCPLCKHWGDERVGPQGAVSNPIDGY